MKILHLESSSKNCSVAVSDAEKLLCLCEERAEDYKQSENLHRFVEWALEGAEITLKDLDAVCLGRGPGSYTGLRIGAASAKGFCFGLGIPLIAVDSMLAMVAPFVGEGYDKVVPLIDARRMEVYTAVYDGKSGRQTGETKSLILDSESFAEFNDEKTLFVGDGCTKAVEIISGAGFEFRADVLPSAQHLIKKAVEKFNANEFEDTAYFEPFYLKEFHGTKKA